MSDLTSIKDNRPQGTEAWSNEQHQRDSFLSVNKAQIVPVKDKILTSPAFDKWLDRQMRLLFVACEEPPEAPLIKLIHRTFSAKSKKVTE